MIACLLFMRRGPKRRTSRTEDEIDPNADAGICWARNTSSSRKESVTRSTGPSFGIANKFEEQMVALGNHRRSALSDAESPVHRLDGDS
ncbi:MAG: hypothetical protein ACLUEV_00410 [Alistipes sp.]